MPFLGCFFLKVWSQGSRLVMSRDFFRACLNGMMWIWKWDTLILRVYSWCFPKILFWNVSETPTPQTKTNMEPKHQGFGFRWFCCENLPLPVGRGRSCPVPPWGRSSPARGATLMRMLMCWHPGPTLGRWELSFWRSGRVTRITSWPLVSCCICYNYICIYMYMFSNTANGSPSMKLLGMTNI